MGVTAPVKFQARARMIVDEYINACAKKAAPNKKGEYSLKILKMMHVHHLPRQQEMLRTALKALEDLVNSDIDLSDEEEARESLDAALGAIIRCQEIAADGLLSMGYNLGLEENDGN